jgi:hypothetical protein
VVGRNIDRSKWRCSICKFLSDNSESKCTRCHEEKQVYTDKPIFGGAASKKRNLDKGKGVKVRERGAKVGEKLHNKEEEKTGKF